MTDVSKPIDTGLLRSLADLVRSTGLAEISLSKGDLRIRLTRASAQGATEYVVAAPAETHAAARAPSGEAADITIRSPMVGTARHAPGGKAPVAVGSRVEPGDRLLVIEAMRTFTEIVAEKAGTVKAILVGNGQPVEYGEPLFVIA